MLRPLVFSLTLLCALPVSRAPQPPPSPGRAAFLGKWVPVKSENGPYLGTTLGFTRIASIDFATGDALAIEYVSPAVEATRKIKLDGSTTDASLTMLFAPGMSGPAGPGSILTATSTATWLNDQLRVVTSAVIQPGKDPDSIFTRTAKKVDVRDVMSIGKDGRLAVDTQVSSGGGTIHSIFARATAADEAYLARAATAWRKKPVAVAERDWLGGYRFGMTLDDVRRNEGCANRDYRLVSGPTVGLACRHFPLNGLDLNVLFGFSHQALKSIRISGETTSGKEARRATDVMLLYLEREGGTLSCLELSGQQVSAVAIWDYLERKPASRYGNTLTVTTGNDAWPVVLEGRFDKNYSMAITIRHASDDSRRP